MYILTHLLAFKTLLIFTMDQLKYKKMHVLLTDRFADFSEKKKMNEWSENKDNEVDFYVLPSEKSWYSDWRWRCWWGSRIEAGATEGSL